MSNFDEARARAWLMRALHHRAPATEALIGRVGVQEALTRIRASQARQNVMAEVATLQVDTTLDRTALENDQYRLITPAKHEWPAARLAALTHRGIGAPVGLWVAGHAELGGSVRRTVALVGTKDATDYGDRVVTRFTQELADRGVTVVTGTSVGTDQAAIRQAIDLGRPPVVVLRIGLDLALNGNCAGGLVDKVIAHGGLVVSGEPMGQRPTRESGDRQAWIVAALSRATVLVESPIGTIALPAIRTARTLNHPVFAVPGEIDAPTSAGPNAVLSSGVGRAATRARDVLSHVGLD